MYLYITKQLYKVHCGLFQHLKWYINLTKLTYDMIQIYFQYSSKLKFIPRNISKLKCSVIRSLCNDKRIVIKKFDKGRGIAIINKSDYKIEALRELPNHNNNNIYQISPWKPFLWSNFSSLTSFKLKKLPQTYLITSILATTLSIHHSSTY